MRTGSKFARSRRARRGATIVEISFAMAVAAVVFSTLAGTLGGAMDAVDHARQSSKASLFLRTTAENLATQDFDTLATLDGSVLFEGETQAASEIQVTLEVDTVEVGLLEVVASAQGRTTGRDLGRVSLRRSRH